MTNWKLILKNLFFYRRTHAGVVAACAVSAAALVGALAVGDSLQHTLEQISSQRLGKVTHALAAGDRFFRDELADAVSAQTGITTAAVLQSRASASLPAGGQHANDIQVYGVTDAFWMLAPGQPPASAPGAGEVVVNRHLAEQLQVAVGDTVILRVENLDQMPRETPLASDQDAVTAMRLTVKAVADPGAFGRFNLQASHLPPNNAFVSLPFLQSELDMKDRANILLAAASEKEGDAAAAALQDALSSSWNPADAGLKWSTEEGRLQLISDRVFLDSAVLRAATAAEPDARIIFTYFANRFRHGDRTTPYSFVSAPPPEGYTLEPGEMLITDWLAEDLQATERDSITMRYYTVGPMRELREEQAEFTVRSILPLNEESAAPELMPPLPGISGAENCRDWDPGLPIDLSRIRPKDEAYWDRYRGTPKAYVRLDEARRLWSNRYGNATAVQFPDATGAAADALADRVMAELDPRELGLVFQPVQQRAQNAVAQSVDFGQLFLGLSFFIIAAGLLLTVLIFSFVAEERTDEIGTLRAVGFSRRQVMINFIKESLVLAIAGAVAGAFIGFVYTRFALWGLQEMWRGAIGNIDLEFAADPLSVGSGAVAAVAVSAVALYLTIRRSLKRPVHELQTMSADHDTGKHASKRPRKSLVTAVVCGAAAVVILTVAGSGRGREAAGAFFAAGALLLTAGLAAVNVALRRQPGAGDNSTRLNTLGLGLRNSRRRPTRSLAVVAMLACGVFLIVAVAGNRQEAPTDFSEKESGTGGFAFYGRTSLPLLYNLETERGMNHYNLSRNIMQKTDIVQLQMVAGDEASCLNLNSPQKPQLLGVPAERMTDRGAFTFASQLEGSDDAAGWTLLQQNWGEDVVPGIADQNVILWSLHKKLGDTIEFTDEAGKTFRVKLVAGLANSIFQGSVLIPAAAMTERYPSTAGSRVMLVDTPEEQNSAVAEELRRALADQGLTLTPTPERLAAFNKVQNTYLSIFLVLGGIGLIIGCFGLGVVVLRNCLERRRELALLRAVGYGISSIRFMLITEHLVLLAYGLSVGTASALIAILPALTAAQQPLSPAPFTAVLAGVASNGLVWIVAAAMAATRGQLLDALRTE